MSEHLWVSAAPGKLATFSVTLSLLDVLCFLAHVNRAFLFVQQIVRSLLFWSLCDVEAQEVSVS